MNANYGSSIPWNLTLSYGRALQSSALKIWSGEEKNIQVAQEIFYKRAKFNSMASTGAYSSELEMLIV